MFHYYLWLGLRSLRRNPVLTSLIILTLTIGIAASMTSLTILYVMSADPLPEKSARLFVPRFDNGSMENYEPDDDPQIQLSYIDAVNLLRDARAERQTVLYAASLPMISNKQGVDSTVETGMATTADFFTMFAVPFAAGGPWNKRDDERGEAVTVITIEFAKRWFGDESAIGKIIRMGEIDYRVVGVIGNWQPLPKVYRVLGSGPFGDVEAFWIPFNNAIANEYDNNGWTNCNGRLDPGWQAFLKAECNWLQYWMEFDPSRVEDYKDYLAAYVAEQHKQGRFPRPGDLHYLDNLKSWMKIVNVVGDDTRLQTSLAFAFFLACIINAIGLLLAKFAARSGDIGVRRALGATQKQIILQYLIESGVIGIVAAALGVALSLLGLALIGRRSEEMAAVAQIDWTMLMVTIALSIIGALIAGVVPTWRAARVRPAAQLKSQ